jgi:ribosomal-protein-alanine N-acetyltransferase
MLTIQFDAFPVIETHRLRLRRPSHDDVDALFFLRTNDAVMQYIGRPKPKNRDEIISLIDTINNNFDLSLGITWIITLKENNEAIGTMGFWRMDKENHRAEIGYLLHPDYHGKGIASEALHGILPYAFNVLKFHSIEANADPNNVASKQLLTRAGFVQEAYFHENYYFEGRFLDSAIYCLLHHAYHPPTFA